MKIAVIGGGVAGCLAAHRLAPQHEVTLFEAQGRAGGHVHTHDLERDGRGYRIDSGFIVFNERTYPRFCALLAELGVASQPSSMSFSVRDIRSGLEYNGSSMNALFAQWRNLLRPGFWRMLRDIMRFNRGAPALLSADAAQPTLGEYLREQGYSRQFVEHYLVPMGAAIWSSDPHHVLQLPARFLVRFFHQHGMLTVNHRPQWRVICGGSDTYLKRLTAGLGGRLRLNCPVREVTRRAGRVWVRVAAQPAERFDAVFLACHSDEALALLGDSDDAERAVLGALPYQVNEAVLHTDTRLLPQNARTWAAWNYQIPQAPGAGVRMTYHMGILQSLAVTPPFLVTLNAEDAIEPEKILARMRYAHPLFTPAGIAAQAQHRAINGVRSTYFCGAYWGFGFHEDAVVSAERALEHFAADRAGANAPRRVPA